MPILGFENLFLECNAILNSICIHRNIIVLIEILHYDVNYVFVIISHKFYFESYNSWFALILPKCKTIIMEETFDDAIGVIRSRKSKNRKYYD